MARRFGGGLAPGAARTRRGAAVHRAAGVDATAELEGVAISVTEHRGISQSCKLAGEKAAKPGVGLAGDECVNER